jgi:hypothetical protein
MKGALLASAVAASLVVSHRPAGADWQYTRWGMTPAEVEKAAEGRTKPADGPGRNSDTAVALLEVPYRADRFGFTATFRFGRESQGLESVELSLEDPDGCPALIQSLRGRYGDPERGGGPDDILHRLEWRDTARDDLIVLTQIGNRRMGIRSCAVLYSPPAGEDSGS